MHITYEPNLSKTELMQGDVLRQTPEMDELLKAVHPHFFENKRNYYFLVLTQSCDLVIRQGRCKTPYITLAPVRGLDLVLDRQLSQSSISRVKAELPVVTAKNKRRLIEFLTRLLNNNEPSYFYLDAEGTPLQFDCVAFLSLSVAIRAELHFQKCLQAKITQLTDTFQAKLGWLVGQMYSRVGTPDWEVAALEAKVATTLTDAAIWIDDSAERVVAEAFKRQQQQSGGHALMSHEEVNRAISSTPTKKQKVMEEAIRVIKDAVGDDQKLADKIRKRLDNDAAFSALVR